MREDTGGEKSKTAEMGVRGFHYLHWACWSYQQRGGQIIGTEYGGKGPGDRETPASFAEGRGGGKIVGDKRETLTRGKLSG